MTYLYASIIRLYALGPGTLPRTHGHLAHAAFLDLVRQVDPTLSQALHDANARKPFTLSPLHGLPQPDEPHVFVRAGHECWLRVTLAGQSLFETFIQRFLHGPSRPAIRLGEATFAVSEILTAPGSHPWASFIQADRLLAEARDEDTIALEFASPFGFSLGGNRVEITPRPELLFGGLQKKWDEWCQSSLAAGLPDREWLREHVLIGEWRVRSRMLRFGRQVQVGTQGVATLRLFDAPPETRRALNALADFAFYAGVGRKTTQGMGQTRRLDRWTPPLDDDEGDDGPA